ncbi:MAG: decarboxylating 6-phosphogluconate dehydrogenase [Nitrospira sp.]|nr:decarboxylating 6-phosphogluconate dehydrogenase [bacterium]MBL7048299.1 decarboxylating 6-phosphogluconate dehydrogenase [Nitrospira sp.]
MKLGLIGLGKMGMNMVERLVSGGHEVVAYARTPATVQQAVAKGAEGASSLQDLVNRLESPRIVWLMVPSGKATDETLEAVAAMLEKGDILIDGGNTFYKDSIRHAAFLKELGIAFLDIGTSGGIWGLKVGYCMMAGGEQEIYEKVFPILKTMAPEDGCKLVGPNGAGHFVKMVHNGIEYAMLQAYAEGFEIMNGKKEFNLDLQAISHLWNQGSVVRSWLLELAESAFEKEPGLESIRGYVEDSGEGRWTVAEAIEQNIPAPVITTSLLQRFRSRQEESFSAKMIAALRNEFGGHAVKKHD